MVRTASIFFGIVKVLNVQQPTTIPQYTPPGSQNRPPIPPKKEGWKSIASTILIFIAAPLIALAITSFFFQSYEVDGPSMEASLQNNDRLVVLKLPRTWAKLSRQAYIPSRGTVVVFNKHGVTETGQSNDKQLIKRVVGLPGERIVITDGKVTIYNDAHPEGYNPDLSGEYILIADSTPGSIDIDIGQDEVFVLGDNRSNSLDSRNFGTVKSSDIVGRLLLRILPLNKLQAY